MSAHRRHRRGRAFQPNPYDPARGDGALRAVIDKMEADRDSRLGEQAGQGRTGRRPAADTR